VAFIFIFATQTNNAHKIQSISRLMTDSRFLIERLISGLRLTNQLDDWLIGWATVRMNGRVRI
jgi:hypothetical protein